MIKYVLLLLMLLLGCTNPLSIPNEQISIDARLSQDANGYYHLTLDRFNTQTLHRISGVVTRDGYPCENEKVYWWSSHYWTLTDTVGYIVDEWRRDAKYHKSVYIGRDTVYITYFSGMEVPVVNSASYSTKSGEINVMFAPVKWMVGDTVTIVAYSIHDIKQVKIVLH